MTASAILDAKFVIDEIYEDILEILKINNSDFINRIEICTIDGKISTNSSKDISLTSLYGKIHKRYSKSLAKETWKLNTPFFVPPRQIQLDDSDVFHYIPIIDNLKAILANNEISKEFFKPKTSTPGEIRCFNDGLKFKNSKFFIENMNAIQLKVYIDAYSTTNPLGDEKRDYKLEGIYFKINNLEHALMSKDYITQLVILISDKLVK